ncbi:hypothetical protein G9A89_020156 [Geosiphon pyriformis]|nr:hypothetical protein G9A89_020156 [Geosiphon pyriformis]
MIISKFLCSGSSLLPDLSVFIQSASLNILNSKVFANVRDGLHEIWSNSFEIYTDGSLKNTGFADIISGTATYFLALNISVGIRVYGLGSSTMAELQTVALFLECVLLSCTLVLHLNSQAVIDTYMFEMLLNKDLIVNWVKIKDYSGVGSNIKVDATTSMAAGSSFFLPVENTVVFSNVCYFIRNIFRSVCCACWKAGSGHNMVLNALIRNIDWNITAKIWHSDPHMLFGFTTVYRQLPIVIKKKLYDKRYPNVLCLLCGKVELLDHIFTYAQNIVALADACGLFFSVVLQTLSCCLSDVGTYAVVYKEFVLKDWCAEAVEIFDSKKKITFAVVNFVMYLVELHHFQAWLMRSKFRVDIEKAGLVGNGSIVLDLSCCLMLMLLNSMTMPFFSSLDCNISVNISV